MVINKHDSDSGKLTRGPVRLAYSVAEAAQATGLGRTTLYGLIGRGALASHKIGNRRIIRSADLETLISGNSATASPATPQ